MIGRGVQLSRFEGGNDRPVGIGCEIRRSRLHNNLALWLKMAGNEAVHGDGVEFAQREIGGIGQVDDDDVEFSDDPSSHLAASSLTTCILGWDSEP